MNKNIAKTDTLPPDRQAESQLYRDVCLLIEDTRYRLATTANVEACIMHRQIGKRIIPSMRQSSIEAAVESMYDDYTTDESLTAFTQLDYEDFYEES